MGVAVAAPGRASIHFARFYWTILRWECGIFGLNGQIKFGIGTLIPGRNISNQRAGNPIWENFVKLTQKWSDLKPGILVCDEPTWWINSKNVSRSSRPRMPSSRVVITLLACSASSSEVACCSLVFSSWNLANMLSRSACSSNSLETGQREQMISIVVFISAKSLWWANYSLKAGLKWSRDGLNG